MAKKKTEQQQQKLEETIPERMLRRRDEITALESEPKTGKLYWQQGEDLEAWSKPRGHGATYGFPWKRKEIIEEALKLGLAETHIWRALRVFGNWSTIDDCPETLREALAHDSFGRAPVVPQALGSDTVAFERMAADRFAAVVGGVERAAELSVRVFVEHEPEPEGMPPTDQGKLIGRVRRVFRQCYHEEYSKDPRQYVDDWARPLLQAEREYPVEVDAAVAAATTPEARLELGKVLKGIAGHRQDAWSSARYPLTKRYDENFSPEFVVETQRKLYEALGLPVDQDGQDVLKMQQAINDSVAVEEPVEKVEVTQ